MSLPINEIEGLDEGIIDALTILYEHGFDTFESCQGGKGHCYELPTIRFEGTEFDLIRAWEILELYKYELLEAKRVYRKTPLYDNSMQEKGLSWDKPFNEIIFKQCYKREHS